MDTSELTLSNDTINVGIIGHIDPLINTCLRVDEGETYILKNYRKGIDPYLPTEEPTKSERQWSACKHEVMKHINGRKTLRDEYHLILEKKSELSKACRDWVVSMFTEN